MVMVNLTVTEIDALDTCIAMAVEQMDGADHTLKSVEELSEEIDLAQTISSKKFRKARHQKRMTKKRYQEIVEMAKSINSRKASSETK